MAVSSGCPSTATAGSSRQRRAADNEALPGTATWEGALVGMTPSGEAVLGDSALVVDLSRVRNPVDPKEPDGTLRFADIRFENGESWGDGDLRYSIEVGANQFRRARSSFVRYGPADPNEGPHYRVSGEDFGVVTGVFFGNAHEEMSGVVERHDLSAALGGNRSGSQ